MTLKLSIAPAFLLVFNTLCSAQKNQAVPCDLPLDKAPKLRGFYLGQTYQEIGRRIPGFEALYEDKTSYLPTPIDFRIVGSWATSAEVEGIEDVTITWHFYLGRIATMFVTYSEFKPRNLRDFITQAESTTGLPQNAFRAVGPRKAKANCKAFSMELWYGQESKVGWSAEGSTIVIEDTRAAAAYDAEHAAYQKAKRQEERLAKEEERRRRTTLRP